MKNKITKGSMIVILYDCGTVMSVAVRKRGIIIIAPQFALCYHYIYLTIYVLDDIYKTIYTILCI